MRKIIRTIGATLAVAGVLGVGIVLTVKAVPIVAVASADHQDRPSHELRPSAAITPSTWSAMGTRSGGEVISQSLMGDGSVRFLRDSIADFATVTSIMGDWEEDWFDDYEAGDELDEDMVLRDSVALTGSAALLPYIEQENLYRLSGGVNSSMEDGSVRFIARGISPQIDTRLGSRSDGVVLGDF